MPITAETYERVALEDPEGRWELICGKLWSATPLTAQHANVIGSLDRQLQRQVDESLYLVRSWTSRLRISYGNHYVPDVCVIPVPMMRRLLYPPTTLEVYDDPVPFVAEVWSPSTGGYDVRTKLHEYQLRGDSEIWLVHPYDRTVRVYRLESGDQAEHHYSEALYQGGAITLAALPNMVVDIERLFV